METCRGKCWAWWTLAQVTTVINHCVLQGGVASLSAVVGALIYVISTANHLSASVSQVTGFKVTNYVTRKTITNFLIKQFYIHTSLMRGTHQWLSLYTFNVILTAINIRYKTWIYKIWNIAIRKGRVRNISILN